MRTRFLLILLCAVLIGASLPGPSLAGGASPPAGSAARTELAQMDSAPQAGERPIEIEKMKMRSRFRYLMLGYGLIWISLGFYLFQMNGRVAGVGREIEDLKGRLEELQGAGRRTDR